MATTIILPATGEPSEYNTNYILYWNNVALDLNRLTHSIVGPQNGPPLSARALSILHLAIHDAYFAIKPNANFKTYLEQATPPRLPPHSGLKDARNAVAAAAITTLQGLYTTPDPKIATATTFQLGQFLQKAWEAFPNLDALSPSYRFGIAVGKAVLELIAIKPGEPGVDQGAYRPNPGEYQFGPDLSVFVTFQSC
jgi:vanadium chloroperoxidase